MAHVFGASVYRDLILSLGFSRVLQQIIYTYVYAYYMYMYLHILIAYVFTYTHTYIRVRQLLLELGAVVEHWGFR